MNHDFPFDRVTLGATAIPYGEIVPHTPRFRLTGEDTSLDTADGQHLNFRRAVRQSAVFQLFGDRGELACAGNESVTAELFSGDALFRSFSCVISTNYDAKTDLTTVVLTALDIL